MTNDECEDTATGHGPALDKRAACRYGEALDRRAAFRYIVASGTGTVAVLDKVKGLRANFARILAGCR